MKAKELIEKLQKFDGELDVYIPYSDLLEPADEVIDVIQIEKDGYGKCLVLRYDEDERFFDDDEDNTLYGREGQE